MMYSNPHITRQYNPLYTLNNQSFSYSHCSFELQQKLQPSERITLDPTSKLCRQKLLHTQRAAVKGGGSAFLVATSVVLVERRSWGRYENDGFPYNWLVVSTQLKNISQNGNLPQVGVKIKNVWNHHLVQGFP